MKKSTTYNLSISKLRNLFPSSQWLGIGDDFCMFNVQYDERLHTLDYPCRFDGLLMLYCVEGHLKLSVNLDEYAVSGNHLVMIAPGNIMKVYQIPGEDNLKYVIVAMSSRFGTGLKVDLKKIMNEGLALMDIPVMKLDDMMSDIMGQHLSLAAKIINADSPYREDSVLSILSSMICLVAGLWSEKISELSEEAAQTTTRSRMVLEQFIRLVGQYHTKHRNVGFYAEKLCLTPKYLSKLIKTASGKSAPEWIDSYVILEAKNLLKYSDMAVKEIVYRLNFPNQSVFYKFFKARTGMTPSEYRNS